MTMVSTGMVIISVVIAVDMVVVVVVVVVIVTPVVTVTVDVIVYLLSEHVLSARPFEKYHIYQYFIH